MTKIEEYIIIFLLGVAIGGSISNYLLINYCQKTYEKAYPKEIK